MGRSAADSSFALFSLSCQVSTEDLVHELEAARRAIARARNILVAREPLVLGGAETLNQRAYRLLTEAERTLTRMLVALRGRRWEP